jgi:hypothetical protein
MAKFKPARGKKPMPAQRANAIGCIVALALLFLLMSLMIYYTVRQG